jgi:hypothetical protein
LGNGTPGSEHVYQHSNPSSPQNGFVYAVRPTTDPADVEVYWKSRSVKNVVWPYELHRYTIAWPTDAAKYQLYIRGTIPVLGPDVKIPSGITATLMPYQEPDAHANTVLNGSFSTSSAGWSLLRYDATNNLSFQVVRSILHTDPVLFPNGLDQVFPADIGAEITEANHKGPRPGYIHQPEGTYYDWEIYDGNPNDPPDFKTTQIIPVNKGLLEVWWSTVNQNVQWPSFLKRYQTTWPTSPQKIIIASLKGGGAIDPLTRKDYRLYIQNNVALPGFNPNDEHSLIVDGGQGQAVFALRDDLGTPSTSEPYSLLKYRDPNASLKWKYIVYKVVAEEAPYFFNYPGQAGTLVQAPFPLSLFQQCPLSYGVSGPFWRDRKLSFWARAAGDTGGPSQIVDAILVPRSS